MKNIFLFLFIIILTSCEMNHITKIKHLDTENLYKKDFNSNYLSKYKINDAIMIPVFQNNPDEDKVYSLAISSISKNNKIKELIIHSYSLTNKTRKLKLIKNQINEKIDYKPHWDKKYWSDAKRAGQLLFDWRKLSIEKNDMLNLYLDASVKFKDQVIRKSIEFELEVSEERYFVNFSQ